MSGHESLELGSHRTDTSWSWINFDWLHFCFDLKAYLRVDLWEERGSDSSFGSGFG